MIGAFDSGVGILTCSDLRHCYFVTFSYTLCLLDMIFICRTIYLFVTLSLSCGLPAP